MVKTNSKEVILEFDLPGYKRDEVRVNVPRHSLIIKESRNIEKSVQKKDFYHREKRSHGFNYKTTLPDVESKNTKITYKKGKLKIVIPRK